MSDETPTRTVPALTASGGKIVGIVPRTIEEVHRLAVAITKSGLAPANMNTPEKLTVAIMQGLEIGLPPMMAVNRIAVVNGRPTVYGDAIPALLLSRGFRVRETITGDGDARAATCTIVRPDGDEAARSFSVADAKVAGLWGKPGPWKQYPDRMLQMRARGFAARDHAADVLGGLYLTEEAEDIDEMKDITPPATKEVVQFATGKALPPKVGETKPEPEPAAVEEKPDEMIADADGFVGMVAAHIKNAKTAAAKAKVFGEYVEPMKHRLPEAALRRVEEMCGRKSQVEDA